MFGFPNNPPEDVLVLVVPAVLAPNKPPDVVVVLVAAFVGAELNKLPACVAGALLVDDAPKENGLAVFMDEKDTERVRGFEPAVLEVGAPNSDMPDK